PRRDPPRRRQRGRRSLAPGGRPPPPARRPDPHPPGRADLRPLEVRECRGRASRRLRARRPRGSTPIADGVGDGVPEVILIATGSEVALALAAHEELAGEGIRSRVVSLPCWELFDRQDQAYRDEVLPPAIRARVSIEEASTLGWDRWIGPEGAMVGMHTFGSSAPLKDVMNEFGFTPDKVAEAARATIERAARNQTSN